MDSERIRTILFMHAPSIVNWPENFRALSGLCYQPYKTDHSFPENYKSVAVPEDIDHKFYDLVLLLASKNRKETKALIYEGLQRVSSHGSLIVCAANDAGGKTIEKDVTSLLGKNGTTMDVDLDVTIKNKCRAVRVDARYAKYSQTHPDKAHSAAGMVYSDKTGLWAYPGMYGWDKIDKGSELLVQTLPELKGTVADFGCGAGYLLLKALEMSDRISAVYGLDNDARALKSTDRNLHNSEVPCETIWADCTKPVCGMASVDTVIMNQPFHKGKTADVEIGRAFIKTARDHLKNHGEIYMVANTHLPYENTLQELFGAYEMITQKNGFKILWAKKR